MLKHRNCILCEIEDVIRPGNYVIKENVVAGKAYVCERHYYEWRALQELIQENNADFNTEFEYD